MHSSRMRTTHSSGHLLGGECLPQCMLETPQVWAWRPPPRPDPSTSPQVWALRAVPDQTPQFLPWMWAWRPAMRAGIPPPTL